MGRVAQVLSYEAERVVVERQGWHAGEEEQGQEYTGAAVERVTCSQGGVEGEGKGYWLEDAQEGKGGVGRGKVEKWGTEVEDTCC